MKSGLISGIFLCFRLPQKIVLTLKVLVGQLLENYQQILIYTHMIYFSLQIQFFFHTNSS